MDEISQKGSILNMEHLRIGLEIMGMGMLGIFTAMIVIMVVSYLLKQLDQLKRSPR